MYNSKSFAVLLFSIVLLLVGCGESESGSYDAAAYEIEEAAVEAEIMQEVEDMAMEEEPMPEVASEAATEGDSVDNEAGRSNAPRTVDSQRGGQRLIIKNADMTLHVADTDQTVSTVADIITSKGGYIVNQNVYSGEQNFRYATMQIGIPVDQFESTLEAFRQLGIVLREEATGIDVTEEFVDLRSRLDNLLATQERLRGFLDETTTVAEALEVDQELRKIEEELNIVQGRVNYLQDRAAFSTINLQINPILPTATPTPTPTATPVPTATPLPTPDNWRPQDTVQSASTRLQNEATDVADWVIYTGIVCGPWIILLGIPAFGAYTFYRRIQRRRADEGALTDTSTEDSAETP